jgi:hypothetical protein
MDFDVNLNGTDYESRYAEIASPIDISNLNGEFVAHAERFGYISFLCREAEIRYDSAKADLDTLEAELDDEVRGRLHQMKVQDEKFKVTETIVKNQIKADPRYVKQKDLVTNLTALQKRLAGARETLIERRYALISLAASVREGAPIRMNEGSLEGRKERAKENGGRAAANVHTAPGMPPVTTDDVPAPAAKGRRRPVES